MNGVYLDRCDNDCECPNGTHRATQWKQVTTIKENKNIYSCFVPLSPKPCALLKLFFWIITFRALFIRTCGRIFWKILFLDRKLRIWFRQKIFPQNLSVNIFVFCHGNRLWVLHCPKAKTERVEGAPSSICVECMQDGDCAAGFKCVENQSSFLW